MEIFVAVTKSLLIYTAIAILSVGQIRACRENLKTKEIIIKIRSKLDPMLSDVHPPLGDLMEKALEYLYTFWIQFFAYTKKGSYVSVQKCRLA